MGNTSFRVPLYANRQHYAEAYGNLGIIFANAICHKIYSI